MEDNNNYSNETGLLQQYILKKLKWSRIPITAAEIFLPDGTNSPFSAVRNFFLSPDYQRLINGASRVDAALDLKGTTNDPIQQQTLGRQYVKSSPLYKDSISNEVYRQDKSNNVINIQNYLKNKNNQDKQEKAA